MNSIDILNEIKERNRDRLDRRIRKVNKELPEIKELNKKLGSLSLDLVRGKDVKDEIIEVSKRKKEILKKNKIREDYDQLEYNCNICKDEGYVQYEEDGYVYQKECICKKRIDQELLYEKSSIKNLINQGGFENFNEKIFSTERDKDTEVLTQRENILNIKEKMLKYCKNFPNVKNGLFFFGPTGTGKTYMSTSIAKELMNKGFSVYYKTANEILDFMVNYSFMYYDDKLLNKDKHDFVFDCDLLIIDDLGSEFLNEKVRAELFNIINTRINANKKTIISSNIDVEKIGDYYSKRIFSRILGEYAIFRFYGSDVRLSRRQD